MIKVRPRMRCCIAGTKTQKGLNRDEAYIAQIPSLRAQRDVVQGRMSHLISACRVSVFLHFVHASIGPTVGDFLGPLARKGQRRKHHFTPAQALLIALEELTPESFDSGSETTIAQCRYPQLCLSLPSSYGLWLQMSSTCTPTTRYRS